MVQCPVCEKEIPIHLINKHLDSGCEYDPATDGSGGSTQQHTGPVASIFQTPAKKRAGVGIGGGGGSKASPMSVGSGSKGGGLGLGLKNASPGVGTKRVASQTATFPLASKRRGSREEEGGGEGEELDTKDPSPDPPFPVLDLDDGSLSGAPPPAKKQKTTTTEKLQNAMPLAERMRPTSLDDICGQDLVGPDGVLRGLIEKEKVPSMILWGSAGCGKTTIARVIARKTKSRFVEISATSAGVAECKKIFQDAKSELMLTGRKTILFCDEIHRFSKSQQDVFLAPVESGQVTLIGATTENPSFKVQSALLSRCRVFTLKKLTSTDIEYILRRALESEFPPSHKSITGPDNDNKEEGAAAITPPNKPTTIPALLDDEMLSYLALFADGDARTALNLLELAMSLSIREGYTKEDVKKALTRTLVYDRSGDMHYDTISAFHKSVRGNDPDAALFWLGRMLASGEDPLYIARRMVVIASEDVGLADNTLLPLATSTHLAVQQIGLPEARINLAHCAVALAEAPKSVRAYRGLNAVMALLESDPVASGAPVPVHLRNAPTRLMKEMGYGKEYKYNPDYLGGDVLQEYLPEGLPKKRFLEDNHLGWMRDEELEKVRRDERERTRMKKEVGRGRGIGTGGWG